MVRSVFYFTTIGTSCWSCERSNHSNNINLQSQTLQILVAFESGKRQSWKSIPCHHQTHLDIAIGLVNWFNFQTHAEVQALQNIQLLSYKGSLLSSIAFSLSLSPPATRVFTAKCGDLINSCRVLSKDLPALILMWLMTFWWSEKHK